MDQEKENNHKNQDARYSKSDKFSKEDSKSVDQNIEKRLPAGFLRRAAAWIIDNAILSLVYILLNILLLFCFGRGLAGILIFAMEILIKYTNINFSVFATIITIFVALFSWLFFMWLIGVYYHTYCENTKHKASPGKLALGIYVISYNGESVKFNQSLLRNASKFLSGLFFGLGYIMAAVGLRKEALHDLISQTLVVRKENFEREKLLAGVFASISLGIFMYIGLIRQDTSFVVLKALMPSFEKSILTLPEYKSKPIKSELATAVATQIISTAKDIADEELNGENGRDINLNKLNNEINKLINEEPITTKPVKKSKAEVAINNILTGDQETIKKYLPIVTRANEDNFEPQNIGFFEAAEHRWHFTKTYARISTVKAREANDYNYKSLQILFYQKDLSQGQIDQLNDLVNPFQQSNFENNPPLLMYEYHFQNKNIVCPSDDLISGKIFLHPKLISHIEEISNLQVNSTFDIPYSIVKNEGIFEGNCTPTYSGSPIQTSLESHLNTDSMSLAWKFSFDTILQSRRVVDSMQYQASEHSLSLWNQNTQQMEIGIFTSALNEEEIRMIYKNSTIASAINKIEVYITFPLQYTAKNLLADNVRHGYKIRFFKKDKAGLNFPNGDSSYNIDQTSGFLPESLSGKLKQGSRIYARFEGQEEIFTSKGLINFSWTIPVDSRLLIVNSHNN